LYLHKKSSLIEDMTINTKDISSTLQTRSPVMGKITREDVLNSIILDKDVFYVNGKFYNKFMGFYKQSCENLRLIYATLKVIMTHPFRWTDCHDPLQSTTTYQQFESNCHELLRLRISLMIFVATLPITPKERIANTLFRNTLLCIDSSIIFNIDCMCDTKDSLHGVCIAQHLCIKSPPCRYSNVFLQKSNAAMALRLVGPIDKRHTLVSRIQKPIVNLILRNAFIKSMQNYLERETRDVTISVDYSRIATTHEFSYDSTPEYQYIFCENTMKPYSKEPIEVLLSAIFYLMECHHLINKTSASDLCNILRSENANTEDKQSRYDLAVTITETHKYPNKHLIQTICHDIIFECVNPALVVDAKAFITELLSKSQ